MPATETRDKSKRKSPAIKPPRTAEQLKKRGSTQFYRVREREEKRNPAYDREIPETPSPAQIEKYCRSKKLLAGYNPWRDRKGYRFDRDRAHAAVEWWHLHITHVKGKLGGQAFKLEPWQIAVLGNIWGWVDPRTGLRRYRYLFLFIPQKNGKTIFCAGLAVMFYVMDEEPGSETYCMAFTIKQAGLLFTMARGIVLNDEELQRLCTPRKFSIDKDDDANAFFRTIAVADEGVHGSNVHTAWVDEEHTISIAKEDALLTVEEKMTSRDQPFLGKLTTAGFDRESICYRDYTYAGHVRDGTEGFCDPRYLPVIWESAEGADWTKEATWKAANPNYGVSLDPVEMREMCEKAKKDPIRENKFRNLRLNQWTQQRVRWIRMDDWDASAGRPVELSDYAKAACYAGLDYGETNDLSSLALLFPPDEPTGEYAVKVFNWIPEDDADRRERTDKVPYRKWATDGIVKMTPGNATDQGCIERDLVEISKGLAIKAIGYDKWHMEQLAIRMRDIHGVEMIVIPQTMQRLTAAAHRFHKLILTRTLRHGGDPCLRWQAGNVEAYEGPNEQVMLDKSGKTKRIDGIRAILNALTLYLADESKGCVYETRGIMELEW